MSAIVVVIEQIPGSVTERDIRENAEALAARLGGVATVTYPLTSISDPPSVWQLLCGALARIKTNAALRRITQEYPP
jgi:hypothetical protein